MTGQTKWLLEKPIPDKQNFRSITNNIDIHMVTVDAHQNEISTKDTIANSNKRIQTNIP